VVLYSRLFSVVFLLFLLVTALAAPTANAVEPPLRGEAVNGDPGMDPAADAALKKLASNSARATKDIALGAAVADAMGRVVGIGLSPVFGLAGYGLYDRYVSETPSDSWYSHPLFTFPLVAILLLIVLKDVLGAPFGPIKQMADAGEVLANKVGGCLGLIATTAYCAESGGAPTGRAIALLLDSVVGTAHAADATGAGGDDFAVLGALVAGLAGGACNAAVWLTGQAFTVTVFLNPFSLADPFLKAARASSISAVAGICGTFPVLGIVLTLAYILFAWLVAGFCIRLITWGTILSFDLLFRRGKGEVKDEAGLLVFAAKGMGGPPTRTLGRLHRGDGGLKVFHYKPWLIFPQKTFAFETDQAWLVEGVVFSALSNSQEGRGKALCTLPPRYRGKAEQLVAHLALQGLGAGRVLSGFRGLVTWVKQLFGKDSAEEAA